ncbi:UDP-N-acetylmuramoyl-L-alanyl-D-glutamate synthetase [Oceanicaulis sp. HTCC2633]|uniref:UDP-N-acetylmuramoyl-L-alanine--D-glutamate ligase n=1 Tax=Oceanicaulis sp. HTCC2633 TaxID=314254 RepID=UPI000066D697|nr:UDP-N-acetylmuramoyl-L-alanine--D-glutamate ligase [Oceanicaulis sp. HTCC2633]EAP91404.1 UDP-N-acetylmuramoyl-L-alanyl-D-glutamate synthetase [Oceanicaulis sp. HTCC2633]
MTPLSEFDAVFIWGFGKEGRAALNHVRTRSEAALYVIDAKEPSDLPDGVEYVAQDDLAQVIEKAGQSLIVKSPGVSLYDARLAEAMDLGAELTSQTNLWFASKPAHQTVIGVTGTKGKSTTSSLLHHMLKALDVNAVLAGNIGEPVIDTSEDAEIVVLELSSYQIADLVHAPDWFIFLNLLNDHAPWHRGVEQYRRDKARLAMLDPNARGVMSARDSRLNALFVHRPNTVWYDQSEGFHAPDGVIHHGAEAWGRIPALPGAHNAANACAALAVIEGLGLSAYEAFESLSSFKGLAHRLETVHTLNGVDFIDDTLCTTPQSCLLALAAFPDRPISLILGGEDREQDYAPLAEGLRDETRIKAIVTIPENGPAIIEALKSGPHADITTYEPDFELAVKRAYEALPDGGIVMMSPAAPRGAAFTYFGARGDAFTQAAKKLG